MGETPTALPLRLAQQLRYGKFVSRIGTGGKHGLSREIESSGMVERRFGTHCGFFSLLLQQGCLGPSIAVYAVTQRQPDAGGCGTPRGCCLECSLDEEWL